MTLSKSKLASILASASLGVFATAAAQSTVPAQRSHGTHRTTSNTRLGRSLISPSTRYRGVSDPRYLHSMLPTSTPQEIADWNAKVEQRKQDKILLKAHRRALSIKGAA